MEEIPIKLELGPCCSPSVRASGPVPLTSSAVASQLFRLRAILPKKLMVPLVSRPVRASHPCICPPARPKTFGRSDIYSMELIDSSIDRRAASPSGRAQGGRVFALLATLLALILHSFFLQAGRQGRTASGAVLAVDMHEHENEVSWLATDATAMILTS